MSTLLGPFQIFSKIREDILEWMFITGLNDTGNKLFTGVNDTGDKFVTDFQWSQVSLIPAINLSPVTTTPAIYLSLVTMTPAINLLPVTTTSVIRVCGVSMNTSFHGGSNETIGGRVRLRRPELLPFWFEVVLAASGASNQGVWDVYGCVFLWWFQWHHLRPRPTPAAGDIAVLLSALSFRCSNFSAVSLTLAIKLLPGVIDTGQK